MIRYTDLLYRSQPDRWLPLQQRRSYQAQLAQNPSSGNRKKRMGNKPPGKEVSGLGVQGSLNEDVKGTSGGGNGGAKGKKGRKGR